MLDTIHTEKKIFIYKKKRVRSANEKEKIDEE